MPAVAGQGEYGPTDDDGARRGRPTCGFYVVIDDVGAHDRRARATGAEIFVGPRRRDHGGEQYTCRDLDGQVWTFGSHDPWSLTGQ